MKIKTLWRRILLGVLFVLPFLALFLLMEKIWHKFSGVSKEVEHVIGQNQILGSYTATIIIVLILLVIFYFAGYLTDYNISSRMHDAIERSFLEYIPGYLVYKNKMNSTLEVSEGIRIPVYFVNEVEKKPAILIEETETEAVIFVPGIPDTNSGEIVIVPKTCIEIVDMNYKDFIKYLQLSGKGLLVKS